MTRESNEFGLALTQAMANRRISKVQLSQAIGTSPSAIYGYRSGKFLPTTAVASKIADALLAGHLLSMVVRMRTRRCVICGKHTVDAGTKPRKYCSTTCLRLSNKGVSKRYEADPRDVAIGTFCQSCEPEGVCRTRECPLRAFSPLPFVPLAKVDPATPTIVWTEERRRATGDRLRKYWADRKADAAA